MKIASREISPSQPPYVIAELGVNHDGSVERAMALVDAAREAGADAVKLQLFVADLLMSRAAKLAAYQRSAGESDPISMLRRLQLSVDQMAPIVARAHARGLHAIVTVFSVELVDDAQRLPFDAYKTASPDIVHVPLLRRLADTTKPMIVSTGAATLDEVQSAVARLAPAVERLALLQCVSSYPTPAEQAELGGIVALRDAFANLPIGYSDHTSAESTGASAVALGACILEKHLTLDRTAAGPDHAASLEPPMLARYIRSARRREEPAQGVPRLKRVLDIESDVRTVSRQSITTRRALPAGHILRRADVTFKRPGTGLMPGELERILGRPLARDVDADMPLSERDIG